MDEQATAEAIAEAEDDPEALRVLAERYLERDEPAAALAVYGRLLERAPDDRDAREGHAWAAVAAGQPERARAGIAALLDQFPADAAVVASAGELHAALGARDEALLAYDRATALAGEDSTLLYRVARDFETADAPEAALALYDRLVTWRPRQVLLARANLRMAGADYVAAIADLDSALAAPSGAGEPQFENQSTARVLLARARAAFQLERLDAADADARAVLDLVPDDPLAAVAWGQRAEVALTRHDAAAARAAAEAAIARDPDYLAGWMTLVSSFTAAGDLAGALDAVHAAQAHHPADPNLVLTAALIRGEQDDFQGAVAEWDRLLAILPDNATALAMRGAVKLQLGQMAAARADVDRALARDPANLTALQTRISLRLRAGDLAGMIADLGRALRMEPHDVDLLLLRAQVHLEREELVAAAADYARVLEFAPDSAAGLSGLGNVQMLLGQYAGALQHYEAAYRAAPGAPAALYNLAAAQAMLGRCPQAVELLRRAVAADPSLADAAQGDEFFAGCRSLPAFAAALRAPARPTPPAAGARPPRGRRKSGR